MSEAALPGFEASTWWGILAPVGGPPQRLVEHLGAEIPRWSAVVRTANIRL